MTGKRNNETGGAVISWEIIKDMVRSLVFKGEGVERFPYLHLDRTAERDAGKHRRKCTVQAGVVLSVNTETYQLY